MKLNTLIRASRNPSFLPRSRDAQIWLISRKQDLITLAYISIYKCVYVRARVLWVATLRWSEAKIPRSQVLMTRTSDPLKSRKPRDTSLRLRSPQSKKVKRTQNLLAHNGKSGRNFSSSLHLLEILVVTAAACVIPLFHNKSLRTPFLYRRFEWPASCSPRGIQKRSRVCNNVWVNFATVERWLILLLLSRKGFWLASYLFLLH